MALSSIISRNVRRFREEQGLSQVEMARRAGLSKQTVLGIEAGRGNPTVETLETIAVALGVTARALVSELGSEVLFQSGEHALWQDQGAFELRSLAQAFGSGYVHNAVIRLGERTGTARTLSGTRGMLRHCYVLEGSVELGPEGRTVHAHEQDFVRFPGEGPHHFEAITPTAMLYVVTTMPQMSSRDANAYF